MAWLDLVDLLGAGGDPPDNNKLALIDMGDVWTDCLPVSSDGLGRGDKQHLLWGYPGILWGANTKILRNNPMIVTLGKMTNR